MRRAATVTTVLLLLAIIYLSAWPVPVDPVAWDAPVTGGLVDEFASNDRLARVRVIDLGGHEGPEDLTVGADGMLYATAHGGTLLRIDPRGTVAVFAEPGGRALGIESTADGALLVANAYTGIQRIDGDGAVSTLLAEVDGEPLVYANDLAVAADGRIYFSESSRKFAAEEFRGTYEASLLDILEHGGHGRVIAFDPATGGAATILDGLNYANGVAISASGDFLLIAETGAYRILRHWLAGPDAGSTEVLLDNLPGFPDNINSGLNGRFWIGLVAPRNELLDRLSQRPWLRKVIQRLPAWMRPRAERSAHVFAIDGDGTVLENLQDPDARISALTGVLETESALYLSSLFGNRLAVLHKDDL